MSTTAMELKSEVHVPFITAGKALVEFSSLRKEFKVIYQITKHEEKDLWFVSVQFRFPATEDEPFGKIKFAYVGAIFEDLVFRHTKRSKVSPTSKAFLGFKFVWDALVAKNLPDYVAIKHLGRCGRCGRRLSDPKSMERGFGPHCWKFVNEEDPELEA
jgi:hypothetical protein